MHSVGLASVYYYVVAGQVLLAALAAVAIYSFYRVYGRRHLLHWGHSWTAQAVYVLAAAGAAFASRAGFAQTVRSMLSVGSLAAGYLQIAWLMLGAWELAGHRDASRRTGAAVIGTGAALGVLSGALYLSGPDITGTLTRSHLVVRWVVSSLAYLAAAIGILVSVSPRPTRFGRRFMSAALLGCALDQGVYLGLSLLPGPPRLPEYALMGIIDLAVMAGLALAVMIWLLEDERERVVLAVHETQRRQRAQACVYRISEAAHSVRDLPDLYRSIHTIISEAIPARNFYIALLDAGTGLLSFPYFIDEYDTPPAPQPIGRGLTEYVLRTRQPLLATPEIFRKLVEEREVELVDTDSVDWLGVPLVADGSGIGVLAVQTYDPTLRLGADDRDLLVFVSEQVATAIEAKRAEERLRLGEARLRQVIDLVPHFIFAKDAEGHFLLVNRAVAEAFGTTVERLLGQRDVDFSQSAEEVDHSRADDMAVISSGDPRVIPEEKITDATGRVRYLQTTKIPFTFSGTGKQAVLGVSLDITDRKAAEIALLRAAKEESLTVLAGGVAHDFNNLLAAMMGHLSLALDKLSPGSAARMHVEKASASVERAAELTRQMLAYSGRGRFVIRPVDLGRTIQDCLPLLEVLLPKQVRLVLQVADELISVEADEGQIQQLLMNLVINGAEAIGDRGGSVTVRAYLDTGGETQRYRWIAGEPSSTGGSVVLEVSDDGSGMDSETLARVFDPFFSTKFTGRGLGLAAVLGIVRGHGAGLAVASAVGVGTSFRILFKPSSQPAEASERPPVPAATDRLRVLVIDDEDVVREMIVEVLEHEGCDVLAATDGATGLEVFRANKDTVDAVILDLSMPGLSGEVTFERLIDIRPDLCVVLSSGYDNIEATRRFPGKRPAGFIQKPYRPADLVATIRRCLAAMPRGGRRVGQR